MDREEAGRVKAATAAFVIDRKVFQWNEKKLHFLYPLPAIVRNSVSRKVVKWIIISHHPLLSRISFISHYQSLEVWQLLTISPKNLIFDWGSLAVTYLIVSERQVILFYFIQGDSVSMPPYRTHLPNSPYPTFGLSSLPLCSFTSGSSHSLSITPQSLMVA